MADHASVILNKVTEKTSLSSDNYATVAKFMISEKFMKMPEWEHLTTSKLRGIYALIMNVYTKINAPEDYDRYRPDIEYLKVRMAYEAGREKAVRKFLDVTTLMNAVDSIKSYDQFMLFCRYAESLVAYFKFYGGEDK